MPRKIHAQTRIDTALVLVTNFYQFFPFLSAKELLKCQNFTSW